MDNAFTHEKLFCADRQKAMYRGRDSVHSKFIIRAYTHYANVPTAVERVPVVRHRRGRIILYKVEITTFRCRTGHIIFYATDNIVFRKFILLPGARFDIMNKKKNTLPSRIYFIVYDAFFSRTCPQLLLLLLLLLAVRTTSRGRFARQAIVSQTARGHFSSVQIHNDFSFYILPREPEEAVAITGPS